MGDTDTQRIIREILSNLPEDEELSLLDLMDACRDKGIDDATVVDSLLPLVYDWTIEFTRQRNFRLRRSQAAAAGATA